jgi:pimeloyl-ACP methyl ester carboxylesterase
LAARPNGQNWEDVATAAAPIQAPSALTRLTERFDPDVIDVPGGIAQIRLGVDDCPDWDALISMPDVRLVPADESTTPDAELTADAATWEAIADDVRGGMEAFRAGRLRVRRNLHLGVGFLAATSGITEPGRLRFHPVQTRNHRISVLEAGEGEPVLCIHGLGGTKASFMPTVRGLAENGFRVIAMDLPGFGDSSKPLAGAYNAEFFAEAVRELLNEMGIDRARLVGNSMGGRVAIEVGMRSPKRVEQLVLLSPALAWLKPRQWHWLLQLPLPRLGLIQPTPRWAVEPIVRSVVPGGNEGWTAAGVDEFLRAFLTPSGRVAFYQAARNIYMEEPHGERGFWTRLQKLSPRSMFVWGKHDQLVPIGFRRHVEECLDSATHVVLNCGHVPQIERPDETNRVMREFFASD